MPSARSSYLPFGRPNFSEVEIAAVARIMRSGWIGMGAETLEFESELARAIGSPHVVGVSSCTAALFLSLLVQGVGPGDEVICPSLTWCSTANAALYLGARAVFCDIDPETLNLTPASVQAALTPRTKAVVAVHFGGLPADIAGIRAVLPVDVALVEDAAHALGGRYADGNPVGASGNPVCFSFYANKNLATGEGGAVALADPAQADRIRSLRQHGLPLDAWKRFTHPQTILMSGQLVELGYKMNFTDLQAAIGRVQLGRQAEFAAIRLEIAREYDRRLAGFPVPSWRQRAITAPEHARHLFVVWFDFSRLKISRHELILALRSRNIGATVHYTPLHRMPLYRSSNSLPITEWIADSIITLPISASMTQDDASTVIEHLQEILTQADAR